MNDKTSFTEAVTRLEQIIELMEEGIDDIDELIKFYDEGAELILFCDKKLSDVESKIEIISRKLNRKNSDNQNKSEE